MISARDAIEHLRDGNRRFVANLRSLSPVVSDAPRAELANEQHPFAIILGCSDSRVPPEIIFDLGLGDLFVIRVAGNIAAPSQVDSVEIAASQFGTRLVIVLGHSHCGAILATLEGLRQPKEPNSPHFRSIVDRVRPSVKGLLATELKNDPDALVKQAVRANVRASANQLRHGSAVLEQLIQNEGLVVVGAEYSLETGVVDFFDVEPAVG
ncbi:MAG: carbonic anhydrase [Anaerolineales bacterium]